MKVLILDDEANLRLSLSELLALDGIESVLAQDVPQARKLLEEEAVDACVVDLRLPGESGLDFLSWLKEQGPDLPAIMISAHGGVRDAVQALKLGAYDFLEKPFETDELLHRLKNALRERRLSALVELGQKGNNKKQLWIGDSPPMKELMRMVEKVAPTSSTVLITGESGTGKELCARAIHELSSRADGPFVAVNVGALPAQLLESELFGYEKGAFTGADTRRSGIFELASGGSLFLDEIGELPLLLQVKLLRALQERSITRIGGQRPIPVNLRIIAATNRDLEAELREGRFREDLYYRLNVIRLEIPPLRERPQDIPLLAGHFIAKLSPDLGKKILGIEPQALESLIAYDFPGNVRELENAVERAMILSEGDVLRSTDFSFPRLGSRARPAQGGQGASAKEPASGSSGSFDAGENQLQSKATSIKALEKQAIISALKRNSGHREKSAADLGFTRRTLLNKMNEFKIGESDWS